MNLNYNNLTIDQLEEYIEFVDWSQVPSKLFKKGYKLKLRTKIIPLSPELDARYHIEDLIDVCKRKRYKDFLILCFYHGKLRIEIDLKENLIWIHDDVWKVIEYMIAKRIADKIDQDIIQSAIDDVIKSGVPLENFVIPIQELEYHESIICPHGRHMEVINRIGNFICNCIKQKFNLQSDFNVDVSSASQYHYLSLSTNIDPYLFDDNWLDFFLWKTFEKIRLVWKKLFSIPNRENLEK